MSTPPGAGHLSPGVYVRAMPVFHATTSNVPQTNACGTTVFSMCCSINVLHAPTQSIISSHDLIQPQAPLWKVLPPCLPILEKLNERGISAWPTANAPILLLVPQLLGHAILLLLMSPADYSIDRVCLSLSKKVKL